MTKGQLMSSSSKKDFVSVANGIQSDGGVQTFFCSGSEQSDRLKWEWEI